MACGLFRFDRSFSLSIWTGRYTIIAWIVSCHHIWEKASAGVALPSNNIESSFNIRICDAKIVVCTRFFKIPRDSRAPSKYGTTTKLTRWMQHHGVSSRTKCLPRFAMHSIKLAWDHKWLNYRKSCKRYYNTWGFDFRFEILLLLNPRLSCNTD